MPIRQKDGKWYWGSRGPFRSKTKAEEVAQAAYASGYEKSDNFEKQTYKGRKTKDPKGGLTAAGRAYFNRKEGSNLKPGVRGKADTPTKKRRKGSFLTRHYGGPSKPLKDDKGRPTRHALQARAWGEPAPTTQSAARRLAQKGRNLLERYQASKKVKKSVLLGKAERKPKYNIYAVATASAKDAAGKKGLAFHDGSKGQKHRDRIADALTGRANMTTKPVNPKTGKIIKKSPQLNKFLSFFKEL